MLAGCSISNLCLLPFLFITCLLFFFPKLSLKKLTQFLEGFGGQEFRKNRTPAPLLIALEMTSANPKNKEDSELEIWKW